MRIYRPLTLYDHPIFATTFSFSPLAALLIANIHTLQNLAHEHETFCLVLQLKNLLPLD